MSTGCRVVQSFEVSPFDDFLAVGSDNGHVSSALLSNPCYLVTDSCIHRQINIFDLPPASSLSDPAAAISPSPLLSLSDPSSKPIDTLAFHPTSSSLLLASSTRRLSIYDIESQSQSPIFSFDAISPIWSSQWSGDGKLVSATSKDGKLRLWDVRTDSNKVVAVSLVCRFAQLNLSRSLVLCHQEIVAHPGLKASRHVHLPNSSSGPQIFTTGFSRTRDREYSLFEGRMLGNPIKTSRVDTSTGVLMPLVDKERSIVYLAGRGDMSLRWVEVGGPAVFTEGESTRLSSSTLSTTELIPIDESSGSTPFPSQIAGAALLPPHQMDLMKAEINRLVVLANDAVVPVPINVPRRQYIDFHSDLYPEVSNRGKLF